MIASPDLSKFRLATADDTFHIAKLLRKFYARDGAVYRIPYDHESCLKLVLGSIVGGAVVVIGPKSCAAASIQPFPFNSAALVAAVLFWYFEDRREIGIFRALSEACAQRGATHISAAATLCHPAAARIYERADVCLIERTYLGPIKMTCQTESKE